MKVLAGGDSSSCEGISAADNSQMEVEAMEDGIVLNMNGTEKSVGNDDHEGHEGGGVAASSTILSDDNDNDGGDASSCCWDSAESGIDETEFKTNREESAKAFKRQSDEPMAFSFEDLAETLSSKKIARASLLSRAEFDPESNRILLQEDRSNIRSRYGYDFDKRAYLYPEEALYLLDIGKIEIFSNGLSLSVQRARSLLLHSMGKSTSDTIFHCTPEEYLVYKNLTRAGYCVYRSRDLDDESDSESEVMEEEVGKDGEVEEVEDNDVILEEEANGGIVDESCGEVEACGGEAEVIVEMKADKGTKRKLEPIFDDYEEEVEAEYEDYVAQVLGGSGDYYYGADNNNQVEPGGYTVDEADSDVEIVDEVIFSHGGVEIQEIGHSVGYQDDFMDVPSEPVPSTSKGPAPSSQVVVDLVSSDDEDEDLKAFGNTIWSNFVPNSKLTFRVPPSALIPQDIPPHDNLYEFDLKDKSDISDLELEFLVDEVSLNDDSDNYDSAQCLNLTASKSWKEWRQNMFKEARDVMNDSLLASSDYTNGEAASDKLFLWDHSKLEKEESSQDSQPTLEPLETNIVFEMFGPVHHGYSRIKAFESKPSYYVSVTKQHDQIPDFGMLESCIDGVPVLIAVVCDSGDHDIVFMTTDGSPLNSLF